MKHIKPYKVFESQDRSDLTNEQKEFLNKWVDGKWSFDPSTGLVDVRGNVSFSSHEIGDLRGIKFGKVSGNFECGYNLLTSLDGAPKEVGNNFQCDSNQLTSLIGGPKKVGRNFYCNHNSLTSLDGAPEEVGGDFSCSHSSVSTLAGSPKKVGGNFSCTFTNINSLAGGPIEVGKGFFCNANTLSSLAGAPKRIGGPFRCDAFEVALGGWSQEKLLTLFKSGNLETKQLIAPLIPVEDLNKEIEMDPGKMAIVLKPLWNDVDFKDIRSKLIWPKGYESDADLVGNLGDIGF